ncbi:MAG TPA: hypothetical protein PK961_06345 [bacterium]|nr:hypothetical protein [bacterium]
MKKTRLPLFLLCLLTMSALAIACGDPSTSSGQADDDDDAAPGDDDVAEPDDEDDDAAPDDDAHDDDDDTSPDGIWSDLSGQGLPVNKIMGIATQMYDGPEANQERAFEIEKLLEAGLYRVRASIDWPDVEPVQDEFTFDYSDPFVELLLEAGLQFDGRLCYGVDWAYPSGYASEIEPADFGDYAGAVAGHYCGQIDSWEIWNEENLAVFWKPEPDPDHYGKMLKAAYTAVHDACPDAKVVFGGLSCFETSFLWNGLYYFLERVHEYHPDIADYFDVLAIHPYTFLQTTSPEWTGRLGEWEFWPSMPGQVEVARQRLATLGAPDKPIWFTEWGWPSLIVGDRAQASWLARGALLAIADGIEALDWYTFYDREPGSTLPTEDYFGLFTYPSAPEGPREKPSFTVVKTLSTVLGESRFAGDLSTALALPEGVYGLAFIDETSDEFRFAGWDGRQWQSQPIELPCPPGTVSYRVFDEQGKLLDQSATAESISVELSNRVIYVEFVSAR